jgi:hypothetical protein
VVEAAQDSLLLVPLPQVVVVQVVEEQEIMQQLVKELLVKETQVEHTHLIIIHITQQEVEEEQEQERWEVPQLLHKEEMVVQVYPMILQDLLYTMEAEEVVHANYMEHKRLLFLKEVRVVVVMDHGIKVMPELLFLEMQLLEEIIQEEEEEGENLMRQQQLLLAEMVDQVLL